MSSQYILSTAHVHSEHHLSCPCLVSTPSLLSMSSQYTISSASNQWKSYLSCPCQVIHHLSCPYPVRMPPKALCPFPVRIQSFPPVCTCTVSTPHLLPTYLDSTPSLQPMSSLYPIVITNVETVPQCIQPCLVISIFTAHVQRLCHLQCQPSYLDLSGHWVHLRIIRVPDNMIWDPSPP